MITNDAGFLVFFTHCLHRGRYWHYLRKTIALNCRVHKLSKCNNIWMSVYIIVQLWNVACGSTDSHQHSILSHICLQPLWPPLLQTHDQKLSTWDYNLLLLHDTCWGKPCSSWMDEPVSAVKSYTSAINGVAEVHWGARCAMCMHRCMLVAILSVYVLECVHVCVHVCVNVCVSVHVCVCVCLCMCVHVCARPNGWLWRSQSNCSVQAG